MPQNISQMSPDKAAAALALMTKLSEGLMPKQMLEEPQESPQPLESAPGEEMPQEVVEEPVEVQPEPIEEEPKEEPEDKTSKEIETLVKDFESFKGEVKGIIETQIGNLTKTLKDALK